MWVGVRLTDVDCATPPNGTGSSLCACRPLGLAIIRDARTSDVGGTGRGIRLPEDVAAEAVKIRSENRALVSSRTPTPSSIM